MDSYQLHLGQRAPPDAGVPGLKFRHPLVQEVDQVGVDRLEDRNGGHGVEVCPVPFVQKGHVVAHGNLKSMVAE